MGLTDGGGLTLRQTLRGRRRGCCFWKADGVGGWLSGWIDCLEINREKVWPSYGWNGKGEGEKFSREQVECTRGSWEDVVVPAES